MVYNLGTGEPQLTFDLETLIGIYNGTITKWDDVRIQQLNPGIQLPDAKIIPLHRSDECGTTYVFTSALSKYSTDFEKRYGRKTRIQWPYEQPQLINSNDHMIQYVNRMNFSIGYVSYSVAIASLNQKPQIANFVNRKGLIVQPNTKSIMNAINASPSNKEETYRSLQRGDFLTEDQLSLFDMNGDNVWPLTTYTYYCVRQHQNDTAIAQSMQYFFEYTYKTLVDMEALEGFIPPPSLLINAATGYYLEKMVCGPGETKCASVLTENIWTIILFTSIAFGILLTLGLLIILGAFLHSRYKKKHHSAEKHNPVKDLLSPLLTSTNELLSVAIHDKTGIGFEELSLDEQVGGGR